MAVTYTFQTNWRVIRIDPPSFVTRAHVLLLLLPIQNIRGYVHRAPRTPARLVIHSRGAHRVCVYLTIIIIIITPDVLTDRIIKRVKYTVQQQRQRRQIGTFRRRRCPYWRRPSGTGSCLRTGTRTNRPTTCPRSRLPRAPAVCPRPPVVCLRFSVRRLRSTRCKWPPPEPRGSTGSTPWRLLQKRVR